MRSKRSTKAYQWVRYHPRREGCRSTNGPIQGRRRRRVEQSRAAEHSLLSLAARRLARELNVPLTGSIGRLVLGGKRDQIDTETPDEWIETKRTDGGHYAPVGSVTELLNHCHQYPPRTRPDNRRTAMEINETTVVNVCTDAVFERTQAYLEEDRISGVERFDDTVTAEVQGTDLYDVTTRVGENKLEAQCTCPYTGPGECKHVVAVLLAVAADPPQDESERVEEVIETVSSDELRAFVFDVLAANPDLRSQFRARFDGSGKPVEEYRDRIETLFDEHTQDYPVVTDAIDFSHFFELAERYRDREYYRVAATVYRALFEEIDDNHARIDAAHDHYATALQSALDGYVECVLAADPSPEEFERYAGALEARAMSEPRINEEQFRCALDELGTDGDTSLV